MDCVQAKAVMAAGTEGCRKLIRSEVQRGQFGQYAEWKIALSGRTE
ncbi:MAG: hypothetical protein ACTS4U_01155 [Candidatus Hodgkinia cicadicola]